MRQYVGVVDELGQAVRYRVLDAVAVRAADGTWREAPTAKQRTLLASLLMRGNEWVSVSRLIEMVWAGQPPRSAPGNLKTYVWRLRSLLVDAGHGSDRLESRPGGYRLLVEPGALDLHVFQELADQGRQALAAGESADARRLLATALSLAPAEPVDDRAEEMAAMDKAHLHELVRGTHALLVEADLAAGRPDNAITLLRRLVADQPLVEQWWAMLIRALVLAGRRSEAITAYQRVCRLLDRQLGLTPGALLRDAYGRALVG
ncbi:tetratricopeptide repeat protein [Micromonospora sp. R77]|uniref:AfsR/SARP family transcriptional regulator n=1 Tax=Micromonospora sp. R77 TaxID=2925836 RepID=UPI001F61F030|nr:BTAD domain-containing putative transcriptional regulator [Micromonospora sp. R77]MCI4066397.1 tetratricopeptide repeat protein [Micromonospora sp. R77]